MPELPICLYCEKPLNLAQEIYVVTNKHLVKYENQWLYAHVDCQRKEKEPKKMEEL